MEEDISNAVREVCLSFPDAEAVTSQGSQDFPVRGKTFTTRLSALKVTHLCSWIEVAELVAHGFRLFALQPMHAISP